jgi:hypothetical protein
MNIKLHNKQYVLYNIIRVPNLMHLKSTKYACNYALKKIQIYFKNMHLIFF